MQSLKKFYFGKSKVVFTPFVSTWKTDNLSSGSSTATQVKLPLVSTGSYNFVVEWGDGTQSTITAWNQAQATKTYTVAGTYQITIKGKCIGWVFNNNGDILKILSVQQWGSLSLGTNQGNYFYGCANLNLSSVSDVLNLSGLSSINYCFRACSSITTINRINEWNLGNLSLAGLFYSCTSFNQDLGLLDVSKSSSFSEMFFGCNLFNNGGSSSINNWAINTSNGVSFFGMFQNAPAFNQPLGSWNTSRVTSMNRMFNGATAFNNGLASGVAGNMFWNFTNVTTTFRMFFSAGAFNQNLGTANFASNVDFANMFNGAVKFNNGGSSDINNWTLKTTGSINMAKMFSSENASPAGNMSFNQPINSWNTIAVTDMSYMFGAWQGGKQAIYNQPIAGLNTANVTSLSGMFFLCTSFNQSVGSLNVSSCIDFANMFSYATAFNNGGSSDINNWTLKTTGSINMAKMFSGATVFNQPIGAWNTIALTNASFMFYKLYGGSMQFNQPLPWNTIAVTDMSYMFGAANSSLTSLFNQDIGSWNVSNVTNFAGFMVNKSQATFSTANLDAIYNGWSSRPVKTPITISFGAAKYTAAGAAGRAILTGAPNNWAITDGGI